MVIHRVVVRLGGVAFAYSGDAMRPKEMECQDEMTLKTAMQSPGLVRTAMAEDSSADERH